MPDDGRLVSSPGTAEAPPTSTEAPQSRSDDPVERTSGPPGIAVRPSAVATASFVHACAASADRGPVQSRQVRHFVASHVISSRCSVRWRATARSRPRASRSN
jgi:hypothetical protein